MTFRSKPSVQMLLSFYLACFAIGCYIIGSLCAVLFGGWLEW